MYLSKSKLIFITIVVSFLFGNDNILGQTADLSSISSSFADVQMDYEQIEVERIFDLVKTSISVNFPEAQIAQAYTNKHGKYKLILALGDSFKTVYANLRGELLGP